MPLTVKIAVMVAVLSGQIALVISASEGTPLRVELGYYLIGVLLPVVGLLPAIRHRYRSL